MELCLETIVGEKWEPSEMQIPTVTRVGLFFFLPFFFPLDSSSGEVYSLLHSPIICNMQDSCCLHSVSFTKQDFKRIMAKHKT